VLCTNSIPLRRRARLISGYARWAIAQREWHSKTPGKYSIREDGEGAHRRELVASRVARDAVDLLNY
jgi:hypothetical protein